MSTATATAPAIEPATVSRYAIGDSVLTTFHNYIAKGTIATVHHHPAHGWLYNLSGVEPHGRNFIAIRERHLFPASDLDDVKARVRAHYERVGKPSETQKRFIHASYFRSRFPHSFTAEN